MNDDDEAPPRAVQDEFNAALEDYSAAVTDALAERLAAQPAAAPPAVHIHMHPPKGTS